MDETAPNNQCIDESVEFSPGRVGAEKPRNLLYVVGYIEENLWAPLELSVLAAQANLSKYHFCRAFKRHIGLNPMKFVAVRRVERAKELLSGGNLTISAIANEVGFRDLSNFIRQFKKLTGVTPTAYRSGKAGERASPACATVPGDTGRSMSRTVGRVEGKNIFFT